MRLEAKAILPMLDGDHDGVTSSPGLPVRLTRFDSVEGASFHAATQTSNPSEPLRVDWNAIRRPSDDHAGAVLSPVDVSCTGFRPSGSIIHSCDGPLALERRAKTTFFPSGDRAAWSSRNAPGSRPVIPVSCLSPLPSAPIVQMRFERVKTLPVSGAGAPTGYERGSVAVLPDWSVLDTTIWYVPCRAVGNGDPLGTVTGGPLGGVTCAEQLGAGAEGVVSTHAYAALTAVLRGYDAPAGGVVI